MSRFNVMPRAYRRQLQAADQARVARITDTAEDVRSDQGSAGRLRGIPAIGPNCPGRIQDSDPGGKLIRDITRAELAALRRGVTQAMPSDAPRYTPPTTDKAN